MIASLEHTLLIDYLAERRPSIDCTTFASLAYQLCCLFWGDLERAHPGIDTHRLTAWRRSAPAGGRSLLLYRRG